MRITSYVTVPSCTSRGARKTGYASMLVRVFLTIVWQNTEQYRVCEGPMGFNAGLPD